MNNKLKHLASGLAFAFILIGFAGCATLPSMVTFRSKSSEPKHDFFKSYELNSSSEKFVGEAIVKATDYYSVTKTLPQLVPNKDFAIIGRHDQPKILLTKKEEELRWVFKANANEPIRIAGMHKEHYLIPSIYIPPKKLLGTTYPGATLFAMIKDGEFANHCCVLNGRQVAEFGSLHKFTIEPEDVRFKLEEKKEVDATKGFLNFEIVYSGMDDNGLKFLYREYTKDDLAKPAFYQELTYPSKAKQFRFRKIKVEIEEATSEKIRYKVLEDGMGPKKKGKLTEIVD